jgi:hypothetical protein
VVVDAEDHTALLRSSDHPAWAALRRYVDDQGWDLDDVAVAASIPLSDVSELAIVVTADGEVVELTWMAGDESFAFDVRITDWWRDSPYREGVLAALEILAARRHPP